MSLKLSLLFLCGLFAHSVYADSIQSVIDRALVDAPQDVITAFRITRDVFQTLKKNAEENKDNNAIPSILTPIYETLAHEKGSKSLMRIITEIKETLNHRKSHETMITVAATLHTCFSYEATKKSLRFPWKQLRKIMYSDGIQVVPMMYGRFWEMSLDPNSKENFDRLKKFSGELFNNAERNGPSN